jgi:small subunit ribosomal protein S9
MAKPAPETCAIGRRKEAVARVRIRAGSGKIEINHRGFENYFPTDVLRAYVGQPLTISGTIGKYDIAAQIDGGGPCGQAFALRHGIARALIQAQPELRGVLKASGLLTRDARVKERKKYGQPGARRRFQFSKR